VTVLRAPSTYGRERRDPQACKRWSPRIRLKRGIVGTYHHVSATHLQRYCEEFSFRHSHRTSLGVSDEQRAVALLKQVGGKRLTYRRVNAQA
jgi:hypothetical protein